MTRPAFGLCLPVEVSRVIDGDTVEVAIADSRWVWRIRLMYVWAPELSAPGGQEAKQYAEKMLAQAQHVAVHIPMPADCHNLLSKITFDRIPGYIYIGDSLSLNEQMVAAGHATRNKQPKTKGTA